MGLKIFSLKIFLNFTLDLHQITSFLNDFHATNFKVLFWTRRWISPFRFYKRFLLQVKIGCCIDILILLGATVVQARVARIIIGNFSFQTLLKTFGVMQMGEKHKNSCGTNFIGRHLLLGSMNLASTQSKLWSDEIIWKQIDLSLGFHSVDNSLKWLAVELASIPRIPNYFLTPQSAVTFSLLGKYSAVRVIPFWRRWSHISFVHWTSFKLWVPSIFMSKLPCCVPVDEWLCASRF